jgi:hypothetical protein
VGQQRRRSGHSREGFRQVRSKPVLSGEASMPGAHAAWRALPRPANQGAACGGLAADRQPPHFNLILEKFSVQKLGSIALFGPLKQILPDLTNFCRFAHLWNNS